MEKQLFREKSMERISSPESLHDYMRVTSPRLWMLLSAIVILLAGFLVFASTATMENTMDIQVKVESINPSDSTGEIPAESRQCIITARIPADRMAIVEAGMKVRIGGEQGRISTLSSARGEKEMLAVIEPDRGYTLLPDGSYDAQIVIESTTPISFLWNKGE